MLFASPRSWGYASLKNIGWNLESAVRDPLASPYLFVCTRAFIVVTRRQAKPRLVNLYMQIKIKTCLGTKCHSTVLFFSLLQVADASLLLNHILAKGEFLSHPVAFL